MSSEQHHLEDPELFLAMDDLDLVARGVVEGALHGLHRSPYLGFSAEFDAHRQYEPGDDLRYVNWNLWARTDRLYVKQFKSDTNLNLYLLLDTSASMLCKHGPYAKWEYGARLLAALSWLALNNRDSAGVHLLTDHIADHIPPRVRPDQFNEILACLSKPPTTGQSNLAQALDEVLHLCRRRGIMVLVSDLFDEDENLLRTLDTLRLYGHEVLVIHLLDPWESELPARGQYEFHDLENGDILRVNTPSLRRSHAETVKAWRETLEKHFTDAGVEYRFQTTDAPLIPLLVDYLLERSQG